MKWMSGNRQALIQRIVMALEFGRGDVLAGEFGSWLLFSSSSASWYLLSHSSETL